MPQLAAVGALGDYAEVVPVSARLGKGVAYLRDLVMERMPEGPALYPDEEVTDQPLDVRLAELVREKALAVTHQEVPHSIAVVIEEMEPEDGLTSIHASLIVERESQKGIVIGKGGRDPQDDRLARPRGDGAAARGQGLPRLHVKVLKEWQRDPRHLERLGF